MCSATWHTVTTSKKIHDDICSIYFRCSSDNETTSKAMRTSHHNSDCLDRRCRMTNECPQTVIDDGAFTEKQRRNRACHRTAAMIRTGKFWSGRTSRRQIPSRKHVHPSAPGYRLDRICIVDGGAWMVDSTRHTSRSLLHIMDHAVITGRADMIKCRVSISTCLGG